MSEYAAFLEQKAQLGNRRGFEPISLPDWLFPFQRDLVSWAIQQGRGAILADCGLGKTPMQLVWADNVQRHTRRPVLLLTPLAVTHQTVAEAEKFSIGAVRSHGGEIPADIVVTNYERLHLFNPDDFAGVVCDESSILKSFEGVRRAEITEFLRTIPYRLLCTATAAPNDFIEFGTSAEALGELGYTDMLTRFFKNDQNVVKPMMYRNKGQNFMARDEAGKWRFKGHAETPFWQWVCSWARAVRKPSDLGYDDGAFQLPPLNEQSHLVTAEKLAEGMLFSLPAVGLREQREERARTITERCTKVAELTADTGQPALVWCHMNQEGDLLESLIPDAVQISGKDSDEAKEEKFIAFTSGEARVLITKPKIGAWGLNFQHCRHITFFPSHSFEQYYQGVRRCWRFGQDHPVHVDVVTTEGEVQVLANLQRKAVQADRLFTQLIAHMQQARTVARTREYSHQEEVPAWLSPSN